MQHTFPLSNSPIVISSSFPYPFFLNSLFFLNPFFLNSLFWLETKRWLVSERTITSLSSLILVQVCHHRDLMKKNLSWLNYDLFFCKIYFTVRGMTMLLYTQFKVFVGGGGGEILAFNYEQKRLALFFSFLIQGWLFFESSSKQLTLSMMKDCSTHWCNWNKWLAFYELILLHLWRKMFQLEFIRTMRWHLKNRTG